jgi:WD40 repeat protein
LDRFFLCLALHFPIWQAPFIAAALTLALAIVLGLLAFGVTAVGLVVLQFVALFVRSPFTIYSMSFDKDGATRKKVPLGDFPGAVSAASFGPSGKPIAAVHTHWIHARRASFFDLRGVRLGDSRSFSPRGEITNCLFSGNGKRLLVGTGNPEHLYLIDIESRKTVCMIKTKTHWLDRQYLAISHDGTLLLRCTTAEPRCFEIWNLERRERIHRQELPAGKSLGSCALSSDGKLVALGIGRGDILVRERASQRLLHHFLETGSIRTIAFSPSGDHLIAHIDSILCYWSLTQEKAIWKVAFEADFNTDIDKTLFSPDANYFAVVRREQVAVGRSRDGKLLNEAATKSLSFDRFHDAAFRKSRPELLILGADDFW